MGDSPPWEAKETHQISSSEAQRCTFAPRGFIAATDLWPSGSVLWRDIEENLPTKSLLAHIFKRSCPYSEDCSGEWNIWSFVLSSGPLQSRCGLVHAARLWWYGRSGLRAERTGHWVLRWIDVLIKTSKIVVDWIVETFATSLYHTLERITLPAPTTPGLSMKCEWEWSVLLFSSFFLLPPLPSLLLSEGERGEGQRKKERDNFRQTSCSAWTSMLGSISHPWDYDLSRNQ